MPWLAVLGLLSGRMWAADLLPSTAPAIREEASRPNHGGEGWPLPLAGSWQCGHYPGPTGGLAPGESIAAHLSEAAKGIEAMR